MPDPDDTGRLRLEQTNLAAAERARAEVAAEPDEVEQHERRADKASYLADKLAEAERSEKER